MHRFNQVNANSRNLRGIESWYWRSVLNASEKKLLFYIIRLKIKLIR